MSNMLELRLLGRLDIHRNGIPLNDLRAAKTLALLIYLTVATRPHTRSALAGLLWGGMPEAKARDNLSKALSTLRPVVGEHLTITRQTVALNEESDFWVDVAAFEAGVNDSSIEQLQAAVQLYEGHFLGDFYVRNAPEFEDWVLVQQVRLKELALRAWHTLAAHFTEQDAAGRAQAIDYTRCLLALEPWREEAHRQMMRLLALNGQRGAALAQYEMCRQVLADELHAEPGAETTTLYVQIRDGIVNRSVSKLSPLPPGPAAPLPELSPRSLPSPLHNLPPQPTPFIGRESELAALDELIATPNVRLLTILGSGGMGKTRLALEIGASQLPRFGQGVYFVPLAPIDQTGDIVPTIAEALDFSFYEGGTTQQQILDYLREKEMLLILDNLEHLLNDSESGDEVSQLITTILRTAPEVKIIATSRECLKLQEEQRFPISGIDVPTFDRTDDAAAYGAIRLFEQSARRVQPDFELTGENVEFVVHICQLVEGMPLAILLAAAWLEMLSPQEIAAEIKHSLDFLETDLRNLPTRQRSIRTIFDHSWQLLAKPEQAVFQQIAIFRGGFTKAAAQAIAGASLRDLMALINKSLIYRAGEDRYDIHELLRQFAAEKLAHQGLEATVRDQHSAYYCAFLHQQENDLKGPRHQTVLTEIEVALENIKAAWNWAADQGYVEYLDQAIFSLADFYYWRIRWQEGEGLCRVAAEKLTSVTSKDGVRVRAKALTEQGRFNFMLGRLPVARQHQHESLTLLDDLASAGQDIRAEKAYALWIMGETEWYNPAKAILLFTQGLAINESLGNDWLTAQLLREMGNATSNASHFERAQALIEESLAVCQTLGYRPGRASALTCLAYNALPQGRFEEAARLAQEILKIEREFGDRRSLARGFLSAGLILTWAGEFVAGQTMLAECLPIYSDQGARSSIALVHAWLGYGNCHLGNYEQARSQIEHALALYQEIGTQEAITRWFLGQTLLALARYDEALVVLQKSVPEFQATGQRNEWGLVLGTLGYTLYKLGNLPQARKHLAEALQLGVESRAFMPLYAALPVISLFLVDQGQIGRAVELYALISRYPPVAKSRWFADTVGQHIEAAAKTLPPGVVAAARIRGRSRDIWRAAETLLSDRSLELTSSATPPPVHNLPLQPTSFIGREDELAEIT